MIGRVVEVGSPARLTFRDLQLRIERDGLPPATVPLEDLAVLVVDYAQTTLTAPLLAACAEANVAVVFCDGRHTPCGMLTPLEGHTLHTRVLREQVGASEPTRKRLWQSIVRAKIAAQATVLVELLRGDAGLIDLVDLVRSGDPENVEGRAARAYFSQLFGEAFVRNREQPGINAMLNYGYAVMRAAVARAIVGAGLHPALGIHHSNQYNPFALADDLLEPLRPLVDILVYRLFREHGEPEELSSEIRRELLACLTAEVEIAGKRYPLITALGRYAANLRECLCGEARALRCPGR